MKTMDSILRKSGQLWKLTASLVLSVMGFVMMVIGIRVGIESRSKSAFVLVLVGIGISLIFGIVVPGLTIRCPGCKCRWYWRAMKSQEAGAWLLAVLSAEHCPSCDYTGRAEDDGKGP